MFEAEGKYFIKSFLLDSTLNLNKWGVTKNALLANLDTFIGKPFILTPDFGHPESDSGDNLLKDQEAYRVGNIIEVGYEAESGKAFAISEITDEKAVKILRDSEVNFVSPSIVFGEQDVTVDPQSNEAVIHSFEGAHLAAVKEPAYGVDKAQIKGKCSGDTATCKKELAIVQAKKNFKTIIVDDISLIFDANLDQNIIESLVESSLNRKSENHQVMTAQEEDKKDEKEEAMDEEEHKEEKEEAQEEEEEKKEEAQEDPLKEIKEEVKALKAELKSLKSKARKASLEPIAKSIVSAKQKLGIIKEAQANDELNKLIKMDAATLENLSAEYENLVAQKTQPKYSVRYASTDSDSSSKVYMDDLFVRGR